jgi:DNA-binding transcriptional regulator YbjK
VKEIRQQKKQPEVIRKRILEQATILVSQKGISGVSIQNIATAVGITKGGYFTISRIKKFDRRNVQSNNS